MYGKHLTSGCEADIYLDENKSRVIKLYKRRISAKCIQAVAMKYKHLQGIGGIVHYCDQGYDIKKKRHYFVFKYLDGESLADLSYVRSFALFETFRILREIVEIMVEVHGRGVVHGDIHGENVIKTGSGKLVLIDLFHQEKIAQDDIVDICKLFYELKYNSEPIPLEIRDLFPKKRDAILRRYQNIGALQEWINALIFRANSKSKLQNKI